MAGLVVLGTFANIVEAQIARAKLEAYDVPAFLFDEHLGGNLFPIVAMTGVRLMVLEDHLEEASRLLDEDELPEGETD